jgi:Trk-type K+ transport system membrane component
MVMIEIIIGGIGFPLIYDVIQKNNCKRKGVKYKVTLFTKVALTGYIAVFIVGIASAYGFEYGYPSNIVNSGGLKDIVHYACSNQEFGKNEQFNKA